MNIINIRTSENSYFHVAEHTPVFASDVKIVQPTLNCQTRTPEKNLLLYSKLVSLLKDKPGYVETAIYKLLQLESLKSDVDVLLIINSYNIRVTNVVIQEITKLLIE